MRNKEIQRMMYMTLSQMEGLGMNNYLHNREERYSAEYRAIESIFDMLPNSFWSIWYSQDRSHIGNPMNNAIIILTFGRGKQVKFSTDSYPDYKYIDDGKLLRLINVLEKMISKRERAIEDAQKGKSQEEVMEIALKVVKNALPDKYDVQMEKGKLNLESKKQPYDSIVIRERSSYRGSIVIDRNGFGEYKIETRVPLCGSTSSTFSMKNMEKVIEEHARFVTS